MTAAHPACAVNLLDPDLRRDPFATYDALRSVNSVVWNRWMGFWMVVGYSEARRALFDHDNFTSSLSQHYDHSLFGARTMIFTDPPRHTGLRQVFAAAFAPDAVQALQPVIREIAVELLDRAFARPRFDFVSDVAGLPVMVICRLLGLPREDWPFLKHASDEIVSISLAGGSTGRGRRAAAARVREYFERRIVERFATGPQGDLLDHVCAAYPAPEGADLREMTAGCMLVLVAGHETTTSFIGNVGLRLLRSPELRERLAAEPDLLDAAVEELLRLDGPVHALRRRTKGPVVDFGGVDLGPDSLVLVLVAAANRDPDHFAEPAQFRPRRQGSPPHLGFGWGQHYCLGARLARLEARVLLEELLTRPCAGLAVPVDEIAYVPSVFVRGPVSVPCHVA